MVGVPGKSKGCHTCRRRKIRCNLDVPDCKQCTASRRFCEGYAKAPVFLNRTAQGLVKRARLEETQLRNYSNQSHGSHIPHPAAKVTRSEVVYLPKPTPTHDIPHQFTSNAIIRERFHTVFLESYLPSSARWELNGLGSWLTEIMALDQTTQAVKYSLSTLAMIRAGRMCRNQDMIWHGKIVYGSALRQLRKDLMQDELVQIDQILTACWILAVYELFESTSGSLAAYENHILGLARLLECQDGGWHKSNLGHALSEEIQYACMIHAIQTKKFAPFKNLMRAFQRPLTRLGSDQSLFEQGFAIARLLEDLDTSVASKGVMNENFDPFPFLQRWMAIEHSLMGIHKALVEKFPLEPPSQSAKETRTEHQATSNPSPLNFSDPNHALSVLLLWSLELILSITLSTICTGFDYDPHTPIHSEDSATSVNAQDPSLSAPPLVMWSGLSMKYSSSKQIALADKIMSAVPYATHNDQGLGCAHKSMFPLRVALFVLRKYPSQQLANCSAIFNNLVEEKGLNFARDIAQITTLAQWGETL